MKRFWKIGGIAALVAILGLVAVGAVAYAQDDDGSTLPFDFGQRFKEAIAEILGISVEDYDAAVDQAQERVVGDAVTEGWLTEDQAEMLQWRMEQAPGLGMRGMGKGMPRFEMHGMFGPGDNLISVAADELDMSQTDLLTALQDGKSIADVAEEQGVEPQAIVDAYLDQLAEDLNEAVADGRITQKQADYQLEQVRERVTDRLDNTWMYGPGEFGGRGHGRMGGFLGPGW